MEHIRKSGDSSESTYQCDVCRSVFLNSLDLLFHKQMHDEEELTLNYKCNECGRRYSTERQLNRHVLSHSEELKPFRCKDCALRFKLKNHLINHIRKHDLERQYVCPHCGYRFEQNTYLQSHLKSHEDIRPYICDICHSAFKRNHDMKAHRSTHSEVKLFPCQECGADFKKQAYLNKHMKTHTKDRFSCELCGVIFKEEKALVGHVRLHSREKKTFVCHICDQSLLTQTQLQDHVKSHLERSRVSKGKTFHCYECGCNFMGAKALELHISFQHDGEISFQCQFCQANFTKDVFLMIHVMKHISKSIFCIQCTTYCNSEYEMAVHEWQHAVDQYEAIEVSNKRGNVTEEVSFFPSTKADLPPYRQSNSIEQVSQRYNCEDCGCFFDFLNSLEQHRKLQHKGEMPFQCNLCMARFNEERFLNVHMFKHLEKKVFCLRCKITCDSEYELGIHDCQKVEREKFRFYCDNCGCSFMCENLYLLHCKLQHEGIMPYTCQSCKATFTLEKFLNVHQYKHVKKKIICVRCNKICNSEYEAGNHVWHHFVNDNNHAFTKSNLDGFETENLDGFETENLDGFETENLDGFETENLDGFETENLDGFETENLDGFETENLDGFVTENLDGFVTENLDGFETENLDGFETENLDGFETENLDGIETENLDGIETENLDGIETENLDGIETENLNGMEAVNLNGMEIFNLPLDQKQSPSPVPKFHCSNCSCNFEFEKAYKLHVEYQHIGKCKYGCKKCTATFTKEIFLSVHAIKHMDKPTECRVCKKNCESVYEAGIHEWIGHYAYCCNEVEFSQSPKVEEIIPRKLNSIQLKKSQRSRRINQNRKLKLQQNTLMDESNAVNSGILKRVEEMSSKKDRLQRENISTAYRATYSKLDIETKPNNRSLTVSNESVIKAPKKTMPLRCTLRNRKIFGNLNKANGVLISKKDRIKGLVTSPNGARYKTTKSNWSLNILDQSATAERLEQLCLKWKIKPCFVKMERKF